MRMKVNGMTYRVELEGEGPPLLLLHGFTGNLSTWDSYMANLKQKYKVIRIDHIGHGQTDAPDDVERYSMGHAVQDILNLFDQLGVEHAHVIGYSLGGRVALSLAVHAPERIQTLLLAGSSPGLATTEERDSRIKQDEELAAFIETEGVQAFVDRWEEDPMFASQKNLPADVRDRLRMQRLQNRATGLKNSLRGMGNGIQPPLWDCLEGLSIPTLLVVGEWDEKLVRLNKQMHERLPISKLEIVAESGHAIHLDQPEAFEQIMLHDIETLHKKG